VATSERREASSWVDPIATDRANLQESSNPRVPRFTSALRD
jgi:hypothetical protein